jgi:hypothetical protein
MRISRTVHAVVLVATLTQLVRTSRADVTITIAQVGSDVVATSTGSLNLTDLTPNPDGELYPTGIMRADIAWMVMGPNTPATPMNLYQGISGPDSFGTTDIFDWNSGTGDIFGLLATGINGIVVAGGYVSGAPLSATDTFRGESISGLGLTPGTYTWTWGTGANADSLTLQIGPAAVPEPSSALAVAFAALAGLGVWARRRRAARSVS